MNTRAEVVRRVPTLIYVLNLRPLKLMCFYAIVKAQIFPVFPVFPMGTSGSPITIGQC